MKKLNIGSAGRKKEGFINVDHNELVKPDVVHDLNSFPYPFADNEFDEVHADHILEHLQSPFDVMREIHRITKPDGKVLVKTPHFSRGFTHSEHKSGFDVTFPHYFQKEFIDYGYFGVDFDLDKMELHWLAFPHLYKYMGVGKGQMAVLDVLNTIITGFANLNQRFCSRIWCFWVGGFEEIEYRFTCKKN